MRSICRRELRRGWRGSLYRGLSTRAAPRSRQLRNLPNSRQMRDMRKFVRTTDLSTDLALRAMSLQERVQCVRSWSDATREREKCAGEDFDWAACWPARRDFVAGGGWQLRLDALGCTEHDLKHAMSSTSLRCTGPGSHLTRFVKKLADLAMRARNREQYSSDPGIPPIPPGLRDYAQETILSACSGRFTFGSSLLDEASVSRELTDALLQRLQSMVCPSVIRDMQQRSGRGELRGSDAATRFRCFTQEVLQCPAWHREFFSVNAVLTREVYLALRLWASHLKRLFSRFSRDRDAIALMLRRGESTIGKLTSVKGPLGEVHRGGQAVCVLAFESGVKVLYKPRSLRPDLTFYQVLKWLASHGVAPAVDPLPMVDRGAYGWCEFIQPTACKSRDEVRRFYARSGIELCVLYLLGTRDVFAQNVRASGEQPCLFDLECLLTPEIGGTSSIEIPTLACRVFRESVLATGLLPQWSGGTDIESGMNMGALHSVVGKGASRSAYVWEGGGRDDMRLGCEQRAMADSDAHLPSLEGQRVPVDAFHDAFVNGFKNAYDAFLANRAGFMARGGLFDKLGSLEVRVLIRSTVDYARIQFALSHSEAVRDSRDVDRFLETLFLAKGATVPFSVVQSELDQLWNGDVPYFRMCGDSRDLTDGFGNVVCSQYAVRAPASAAYERLIHLSAQDRERQLTVIAASLWSHHGRGSHRRGSSTRRPGPRFAIREGHPSKIELMNEAVRSADIALAHCLEDKTTQSWIGLTEASDGKWSVRCLDHGIDDGAEGIALLMLYLHRVTGAKQFGSVATKILDGTCCRALRRLAEHVARVDSAFVGFPSAMRFPASALSCLMHGEAVLQRPYLTAEILDGSLRALERGLACRATYSYRYGGAGLICLLLDIYEWTGHELALELAERCGAMLAGHTRSAVSGGGWSEPGSGTLGSGFGRGLGGVAVALFRLALATDDPTLRVAAAQALAAEGLGFRADSSNPRKLRGSLSASSGWSHGAAGVALSRLFFLDAAGASPIIESELDLAVERCLANGLVASDSLCDGNLGNLDIVFTAAHFAGRGDWMTGANELLAKAWARRDARGAWSSDLMSSWTMNPGLFSGVAGIGMAQLRRAAPSVVPLFLGPQSVRGSSKGFFGSLVAPHRERRRSQK